MIKRSLAVVVLSLSLAGATGMAIADNGDIHTPEMKDVASALAEKAAALNGGSLTTGDIAEVLQSRGFRIEEIERDDGKFEVEAKTPAGREVEFYVRPQNGAVLPDDD